MRLRNYPDGWHPWFAWYPVQTEDGWLWLEIVERHSRKLNGKHLMFKCRRIPRTH